MIEAFRPGEAARLATFKYTSMASHPQRQIRRDLLVLATAWKLQNKVYGGLTAAQKRKLAAGCRSLR